MHRPTVLAVAALLVGLMAGCNASPSGPAHSRQTERARPGPRPELGACRDLTAGQLDAPTNHAPSVPCHEPHTAQTFLVGTLPASTGSGYDDPRHGSYAHRTCSRAFRRFLSADDSLVLRIQLSWAWFRPSRQSWRGGARWLRCDAVGGAAGAHRLRDLPEATRGLFRKAPPEQWLTCARGARLADAARVPCSRPHDWRAISTVKVGRPGEAWPGNHVVDVRSRQYCNDQVGAWTGYAPDYGYGWTAFHEAEWKAGSRRSVCWARTTK
ncbi:MAG: septum formation family protein [Marmoricola sp.]